MKKKYVENFLLDGLDCANCATKIEEGIGNLQEVEEVTVNFMMKTLTIYLKEEKKRDQVIEESKKIIRMLEPDIKMKLVDNDHSHEHGGGGTQNERVKLIIGTVLFIIPLFFSIPDMVRVVLYSIAYVTIGGDIVLKAIKNIMRGQIFDENFLMTIATIGAFAIGEFPEGVAVMLFYKVGELFQDMAVDRSRRSITELMDIRPDFAYLKVKDEFVKVKPEDVQVGDIVLIKPGEKVPLDGIIVEGSTMVDTSALTGESLPRNIKIGDEVLSGFINQSGVIEIKVMKEFGESTVSKILELVQNASSRKAKTENFITKFARGYTPVVVMTAVLIAIVPPLIINEATFGDWIYRALVFLVISCPCALVISIPLGFFGGIGAASRSGILIKGSNYLEALNDVDTVIFDKTGTLTKGEFRVKDIHPAGSFTKEEVLRYAAYAENYSNHPIALSIIKEYGNPIDHENIKDYEEIPGHGIRVIVDGKKVIAGNQKLMELEKIQYKKGGPLVGTVIYIAINSIYAGFIIIADAIKDDSTSAIKQLKDIGIKQTIMLTGDHASVAKEVGSIIGIDQVYAQLLPHEKVEKLESINKKKSKDKNIIFVGDGINDAPVLARADIGVAMGGLGSDAAIEAADMVIMTDEPSKIATAIRIAKHTRKIVWQNIIFALAVKGIVLLLGAVGLATMWEAVFADVGVSVLAIFNAIRVMKAK